MTGQTQQLLPFLAILLCAAAAVFAFAPQAAPKAVRRRLDRYRERFSTSMDAQTQAKLKSILANRREGRVEQMLLGVLPRPDELRTRLKRTGLTLSLSQYAGLCGAAALLVLVALKFGAGAPWLLSVFAAVVGGVGLPHMIVGHLIARRVQAFLKLFPDAIDLMVRGLKSGLPINECLAAAGREVSAPVGSEFRTVVDEVRLGRTLDEALWRSVARLDIADYRFFVISLAVQKETGGNLAETLANLSEILRKRHQMKLKVKALASEGKASALILGSLPFVMTLLLTVLNYDYVSTLWTDPRAQMISLGGLVWMGIGAFVMAKMINFEI